MFEDLIKKLKAQVAELRKKLPGGGGDDDYEEDEDDYEEKYHGDDEDFDDDEKTVQVQVKDLIEGNEAEENSDDDEEDEAPATKEKTQKIYSDEDEDEDDEDEDDDEVDADAAAQKRKKMMIYGAVAALVIVLVVPEFMNSEPEPQATNFKRPPKPKKKKRKKPKTENTEKAKESVTSEAPAQRAVEEAAKPKVADIPPETAAGLPPTVEVSPEPTPEVTPEQPAVSEDVPKVAEPEATPEATTEEPTSETTSEVVVSEKAENQNNGMIIKLGEESSADTEKDPATGSASVDDMASKIDKKLEYVAPPNYERSGRGLVYNCVGKHWACVDKFSYLTCRENTSWSSQNGKNPECHTKNVYASIDDCQVVQRHYIESSEPTDFCTDKAPSGDDGIAGESKPMTEKEDSEAAEELDLLE